MTFPLLKPALAFLEEHGITDVNVDKTGKHLKLRFKHQGASRLFIMSKTPSDGRAKKQMISSLRHVLGIWATKKPSHSNQRRKKNRRRHAASSPVVIAQANLGDDGPWVGLKTHPMYRGEN